MSSTTARSISSSSSKDTTSYQTSFPSIPLTTTFTPPGTECEGIYAPGTAGIAVIDPITSCFPSGFTIGTTNYFSPGIICPSGYRDVGSDTIGAPSLTTVTCCPVRSGISLSRVTDINSRDPFWHTYSCTWTPSASTPVTLSVTVSPNGVTTTSSWSFTGLQGVNAYGVRMVYQSSDMAAARTTGPATVTTAPTGPTIVVPSAGASSSGNVDSNNSTKGGLSTGGIVAIAVVIPVVALVTLGALFLWRKRRKGYKAPSGQAELQANDPSWGTSEVKKGGTHRGALSELPVEEAPAELGTYR